MKFYCIVQIVDWLKAVQISVCIVPGFIVVAQISLLVGFIKANAVGKFCLYPIFSVLSGKLVSQYVVSAV